MGRYGDPAGPWRLRVALADWLLQARGVASAPGRVVITQGAMHAIDLVTRTLLRPGDTAAVEEPGYPAVAGLLRTLGMRVVGVPVDSEGLVVEALPATARLVHVTPSHQFPLGVVMSRSRRQQLLAWARRNGAAIVEDDYDSVFRYTPRPLEPLHRLDRGGGHVVYVNSFSKMISPALRLGFAILPSDLVGPVSAVRQLTDHSPPLTTALAMARFIEEGHLVRHLRRVGRVYADRHRVLRGALAELDLEGAEPLPTHAGLHVALLVPEAPADAVLVARSGRHSLNLSSLRRTYTFVPPTAGVVVGFGAIPAKDIPKAVGLLRTCVAP